MTWPERHDLIINGIDFDAALERLRNELWQRIDNHIWPIESLLSDEATAYLHFLQKQRDILSELAGLPMQSQ